MKEINVKKKKKFYEGNAKVLYETDNEELLIQEFRDTLKVRNGKAGSVKGKGAINNQISAYLFNYIESYHVPTHFVKVYSDSSMIIRKLDMLPLKVVMRNFATGSLVKQYGVEEGKELEFPILEFYLKDSEKKEALVNVDHILSFGHASEEEIKQIQRYARKINAVLKSFFYRRAILLVDFKLEFGRSKTNKILLGDEITPETCQLWGLEAGEKVDKNLFRLEKGNPQEIYQELRKRIFKEQ